jgi:DNA polymerase/3'-5' exonuclease PolX
MTIDKARQIAEKYKALLEPHCVRIEIAGSIRRERQEVKDIELVCIPKSIITEDGMFDKKEIRDKEFVGLVNSFTRTKGDGEGKYTQLQLQEEINLDLFMCVPENWGVIFMLRTGSQYFSKRMVTDIKQKGYYVKDGYLWFKDYYDKDDPRGTDIVCPCYEEIDFFTQTKMEYVDPFARVF